MSDTDGMGEEGDGGAVPTASDDSQPAAVEDGSQSAETDDGASMAQPGSVCYVAPDSPYELGGESGDAGESSAAAPGDGDSGALADPSAGNLLGMPAPASPPPVKTPVDWAKEAAPTAQRWAIAGRDNLAMLYQAFRSAGSYPSGALAAIANIHFHFDRAAPASVDDLISKAIYTYQTIIQVLEQADSYFQFGIYAPDPGAWAFAGMGGYGAGGKISFSPAFSACGPNTRAAMILHEGAHFVGGLGEIGHYAREDPAPNGAPYTPGGKNYADLAPGDAVHNACSYAAFAIHAGTGSDFRYGSRDTTL